jgi:hypothetical protein
MQCYIYYNFSVLAFTILHFCIFTILQFYSFQASLNLLLFNFEAAYERLCILRILENDGLGGSIIGPVQK